MLGVPLGQRAKESQDVKTAQQAAQNWQNSAGRAATDWQQGVQNYNGDWGAATTAGGNAYITNVQAAFSSGRWAAGVSRAASTWKQDTIAKAPNYSQGFQAGAAKQAASAQKIMAALQGIVPSLPQRGSYEQNKARATALMDDLHALKGQLGA